MSSKILSFVFASILASLLLVSVVSAFSVDSISELSLSQNTTSIVLHETAKNLTVTLPSSATISDGKNDIKLTLAPTSLQLNSLDSPVGTQTIAVSIASMPSTVRFGSWDVKVPLNVTDNDDTTDSTITNVTLSFVKGLCKYGEAGGNLSIERVDISSSGDDDLDWRPLDEITVEVRVENLNEDDDIKEVTVVLGLYNENWKNVIGDMDFSNADEESIEIGTIDNGDDARVTFTFKVPADFNFDDGTEYQLAVKAYSDKTGESKECVDSTDDFEASNLYEEVSIDRQDDEDRFMAFDQIELSQKEATCGDVITLDAQVYNVGDSDQDELTIFLESKALKVAQQKEFKNGLDMDDSVAVSFEFVVPQGLKDGFYTLELSAEYEDGSSEDITPIVIKVIGCEIAPVVVANETADEEPAEEPATESASVWAKLKGSFVDNTMIWLVAAINIILIVVIIVVAVRIARR